MDHNIWYQIAIGLVAGWIASRLMKGRSLGCLGNILVGVVGAVLGGFILKQFDFTFGETVWANLATAVLGAILLLFATNLLGIGRKKQLKRND